MTSLSLELEGSWEEILAHAGELAGCRVRLTVLGPASPTALKPPAAPERDPEHVARVRRLRGKFASGRNGLGSDQLHQERQADKQSGEQGVGKQGP
jgi:hypothetical protein